MTSKDGLVKQSTWWPLLLFSKYMRGETIALNVRSGEYQGATEPEWIRGAIETPWLDASASLKDGVVSLAVVNIHEEKDFETELRGVTGKDVEVYSVSGDGVAVVNTAEKQEVGIKESKWNGEGSFTFPKHSFTLLRWKL
jgi:alpha-N-arabinofuranosidase